MCTISLPITPLVLFVALAATDLAAASAGKPSGIIALTAETKPVDAAVPELYLRTTLAGANCTLHALTARGLHIQFGETNTSEVVWAAGALPRCTLRGMNPCGRKFILRGVSDLTLEGGGGGLWINQNGNFNEDCGPFSEPDSYGVARTCL